MAKKGLRFACATMFFLFSVLQLLAQPTITSMLPASAPVGTSIVITGTNFSAVAGNNIVYFGSVKAVVTTASSNSLTVEVPVAAAFAPVSVTINGLTAYSSIAFIVTFAGGGAITHNSFEDKVNIATDDSPSDITSADLDGDGMPDIIVANGQFPFTISVYRNTSTSSNVRFSTKTDFASGSVPSNIAIADIDGDGKQDVVVTNTSSFTVSVFRNTSTPGSISLSARTDLPGANPDGVAIGDFDSDGKPDLAVTSSLADKLSIYRNTSSPGAISFQQRSDYSTGSYPLSLSVGDLDGDSRPDIVVANTSSSNISLFRNNGAMGAISFSTSLFEISASGPTDLALADLDGDKKLDLSITDPGSSTISVYLNTGNPGVISFGTNVDINTSTNPTAIVVSDLDGDGKPDFAVSCENIISVIRNAGTAGVPIFDSRADLLPGRSPSSLAVADFDGDHFADLAVIDNSDNMLSIFRNKVDGPNIKSFSPIKAPAGATVVITGTNLAGASTVKFGNVPAASFTIISSDIVHAIVSTGASGEVSVTAPRGTATSKGFVFQYAPEITSFTPLTGGAGSQIFITGSGLSDATSVSFGGIPAQAFFIESDSVIRATVGTGVSGNVSISSAAGNASLPGFAYLSLGIAPLITSFAPLSGAVGTNVTITGNNFASSPVNNTVYFGPTRATIITASSTSLTVTVPPGASYESISVTANNLTAKSRLPFNPTFDGGPSFTSGSFSSPSILESTNSAQGSCVTDLDGDGKPDLVHGFFYGNLITVYRNTTTTDSITFAPPIKATTGQSIYGITPGDLDGDGRIDLATFGTAGGKSISVLRNVSTTGDIVFSPGIDMNVGAGAKSLAIHDLDGDGRPELIVAVSSGDYISVYKNTSFPGNISFAQNIDFIAGDGPTEIKAGDLDGDGKAEIIIANANAGTISILKNQSIAGQINFSSKLDFVSGIYPISIAMGDFDGNGNLDFAVANADGNTLQIFRNSGSNNNISIEVALSLSTPGYPDYLRCSDLNGDGKADLALISGREHLIAVYKNITETGVISYASPEIYQARSLTQSLVIADFNGDGKNDMAAGNNYIDNAIYFFQNKVGTARTVPLGTHPVTGPVSGRMTVDPEVQTYNDHPYVQRHYDIEPDVDPATSTAAITLYFTQTDFDSFNSFSGHGLDLPRTPDDISNKSNLRVYQYHGTSTTAIPGNYSGAMEVINPDDTSIIWNNNAGCWEITFTVNGFSGFFISNGGLADNFTPIITAGGSVNICEGGNVILASSAGTGNQWFKDGMIISNATSATLMVTTAGTYRVNVTRNNVTSDLSNGIVVTTLPKPAQPVVSVDGIQLSSGSDSGNRWYLNGVQIAGAVDRTFKPATAGYYAVDVSLGGCTSLLSTQVYFVPAPVIKAIGNTNLCEGKVAILVSSTANSKWYRNGFEILGSTADTLEAGESGSYTASATSNNIVSAASNSIPVLIIPAPEQPIIIANGSQLESSSENGNSWYIDGVVIPGATGKTLRPLISGNYSVQNTKDGCKSVMSSSYNFVITSIVNIDRVHYIMASPNPSSSFIKLNYNLAGIALVNCDIIDLNGRIVAKYMKLSNGAILPTRGLANGIYFLRISDPNYKKLYTLKILKR